MRSLNVLIENKLSPENSVIIHKYDKEMVGQSIALSTRIRNLRALLALTRLVNKSWEDVTKENIDDVKKILSIPYIDIKNDIDPKLEIKMFGAYLDSIIGNLMSNAIKAINSQDDKETRENVISMRTERSNQHFILYFSDNGPGIPKERWEAVFEPHISTTSKNTLFRGHGLGLPIVHSMVREYEGDVKVIDPVHGQGTTFCITIPWKAINPKN